jgi:hypothetical protein
LKSRWARRKSLTSAWRRSTSLQRKTRLTGSDFPGKTPVAAVVAARAARLMLGIAWLGLSEEPVAVTPLQSRCAQRYGTVSCNVTRVNTASVSNVLAPGLLDPRSRASGTRGFARHPGVGTDRAKAFTVDEAVADRFGDLVTVRGWSAALGLVFVLHGSRLTAMGPDASTALLPRLRLL